MLPSFAPSPARADAVIDELATPESSLESVARNHDTTVEALSLWLITPAIRERLDSLTLSHALHLKLAALAALPKAIDALRSILEAFPYEERHSRTNPAHTAAVEAPRVNARRAAGLLFRIARFVLPDSAPRSHRAEYSRPAYTPAAQTPCSTPDVSPPPPTTAPNNTPAAVETVEHPLAPERRQREHSAGTPHQPTPARRPASDPSPTRNTCSRDHADTPSGSEPRLHPLNPSAGSGTRNPAKAKSSAQRSTTVENTVLAGAFPTPRAPPVTA